MALPRIGAALARLHVAGKSFERTRANNLSLTGWTDLYAKVGATAETVENGLHTMIGEELATLRAAWPTTLPSGVIHADLFPDNVFFMAQKCSGLIDFYFACTDFLSYDLAICLNAWCFEADGALNVTKAGKLFAGYQTVRVLEAAEKDALPILARGGAMRFLLTRLYDWVNTPAGAMVKPKDPREYLRKLKFHRNVKSCTAYGLS